MDDLGVIQSVASRAVDAKGKSAVPDDLSPEDILSSAELVVARVCTLSKIAETATRFLRALTAGDDANAARELRTLNELCEERASWSQDRERG